MNDRVEAPLGGEAEHVLRSEWVGSQHLVGVLGAQPDEGGGVDDGVAALERAGHRGAVGHVADDVVDDVDAEGADVRVDLLRAAHEQHDLVAGVDEGLGGVGTGEPGAAGDEDPHGWLVPYEPESAATSSRARAWAHG